MCIHARIYIWSECIRKEGGGGRDRKRGREGESIAWDLERAFYFSYSFPLIEMHIKCYEITEKKSEKKITPSISFNIKSLSRGVISRSNLPQPAGAWRRSFWGASRNVLEAGLGSRWWTGGLCLRGRAGGRTLGRRRFRKRVVPSEDFLGLMVQILDFICISLIPFRTSLIPFLIRLKVWKLVIWTFFIEEQENRLV